MDYFTEHLSCLRQEIVHLESLNAQYWKRREHSPMERSTFEQWQNRLQEIKQELLTMRDSPPQPVIWWDRSRRSRGF